MAEGLNFKSKLGITPDSFTHNYEMMGANPGVSGRLPTPQFESLNTEVKKAKNGNVEQSERLFTARPRSSAQENDGGRGPYAYIKLLTSKEQASMYQDGSLRRGKAKNLSGKEGDLSGMTAEGAVGYDKFLLTGVSCRLDEKLQITEVFGDGEVAYYFGRQPMMFSFTGVLIDSVDNNWFTDWLNNYAEVFRGSKLAQNFELLQIVLPNMKIVGSMVNCSWEQRSDRDVDIGFQFQFLAKSIEPLPAVASMAPISNAAKMIDFSSAEGFLSQAGINMKKAGALLDVVQNPLSSVADYAAGLTSFGGAISSVFSGSKKAVNGVIDGIGSSIKSGLSSVTGLFSGIASTLNGIRTSLFSPIYGVMTSLTKLVKNVLGSAASIFNSLVSPIRGILRDITNIANMATSLVNMFTGSVKSFGRAMSGGFGIKSDFEKMIKSVKRAKGTISAAPDTVAMALKGMFKSGQVPTSAPFLRKRKKGGMSRNGPLGRGSAALSTQIAILTSGNPFIQNSGATL